VYYNVLFLYISRTFGYTPIPFQNSLFTNVSFDICWAFVVRERPVATLFLTLRQIDQVCLSFCTWKRQGLRISETSAVQHLQILSNNTEKNLSNVALRKRSCICNFTHSLHQSACLHSESGLFDFRPGLQ